MPEATVYEALIADNQQYLPYFRNGFSNHYPMVLWSIKQMGGSEQDLRFQGGKERWDKSLGKYRIDFWKPRQAKREINRNNWRDFLDADYSYADYLAFFKAVDLDPESELLTEIFSTLCQRSDTVLFHALIRYSMGHQFHNIVEQQISLAYWAANFSPRHTALAALPENKSSEDIMARVMHFFGETVDFVALHLLTGYAALLNLPDNLQAMARQPFLEAVQYYSSDWETSGPAPTDTAFDETLYTDACQQAFTSLDDHFIKIIYALKQIDEQTPLPGTSAALRSVLMARRQ